MVERLRLSEILSTSSAVATYLGARNVAPGHVLSAIGVLRGTVAMEDLGRPLSPLVSRVSGAGSGADEGVRELAQHWFARLGSDPLAEMSEDELAELEAELTALAG